MSDPVVSRELSERMMRDPSIVDGMESSEIDGQLIDDKGEHWSSRWAFVMCAIGSAVGLGNVWRFPWLVFRYGGGAFFVPYLLALFFIGVPLLGLEFSLAQIWQLNILGVMHRINRRLTGLGVLATANSTMIASYYSLIICWTEIYMINSFKNPMPWITDADDDATCAAPTTNVTCIDTAMPHGGFCEWRAQNDTTGECQTSVLGRAQAYFIDSCNIGNASNPKSFGWTILAGMTVLWGTVFLLLGFGAKVLGYIMYVTMALPTFTIIVLLVVGVTLEGSDKGIEAYIGKWNGEILYEQPEVWTEATGQIFFSLSVGQAVMMCFASYNRPTNPCCQDSLIVALCNSSYSFLAGFAVFSVAGFLADSAGVEVADLELSGSGLAFLTYPVGIGQLGYPWGNILAFTFFFTLFLLGLDSLVSLSEPFVNTVSVSKYKNKLSRMAVTGIVCATFWAIGLIYCADFGATLLDEVDFYVNNLGLLLLGLLNAVAVGWVFNAEVSMSKVGTTPILVGGMTWLLGSLLGTMVALLVSPSGLYLGPSIMFLFYAGGTFCTPFLANEKDDEGNVLSFKEKLWWCTIGNLETTRAVLNDITAKDAKWYTFAPFSIVWTLLIKYLITGALVFLIGNLVLREAFWIRSGDPLYIPAVYSALAAIGMFVLGIIPVGLGLIFPYLFEPIVPVRQLNYYAAQKATKGDHSTDLEGGDKPVGGGEIQTVIE
eukprot:GHVN01079763.1.p1 GENE.GHVN01079763.1~~GHVN01079763.1.p1  ORF type:complete len:714 (+),score=66.80 GHVN01079763.1:496-2637(+)